MTASPLLVTSRQPVWLRFLLTAAAALVSVAFTSRQYPSITWFASGIGYMVLTGIPWLIVRRLPPEHPVRLLQKEHNGFSQRFWSYRGRENFWMGFGLLTALFVAHGVPDPQHCGLYVLGAFFVILGTACTLYWRAKRDELQLIRIA